MDPYPMQRNYPIAQSDPEYMSRRPPLSDIRYSLPAHTFIHFTVIYIFWLCVKNMLFRLLAVISVIFDGHFTFSS